MPRLLELLPFGHWSAVRLRREVDLHAMVTSAGRAREDHHGYRHDGLKRGRRPFAVVQVTLDGCGLVERNGAYYGVPQGRAMIAFVPDAHVYRVHPDAQRWEFAYAVVNGRELLRLLRYVTVPERPVVDWSPTGLSERVLYDVVTSLAGRIASPYELSARAYRLGTALLEPAEPDADGAIDRARRYLRDHLHEPLSVERLAAVAGLSRHHFTRRFSAAVGLPPVRYLREARCDAAANLLATTDLPVGAIGERCGFESVNYFCRVFRSTTGMTPGQFRRSRP
ncbi:MAG: helix-turn-helix domain-containing protein [Spirochaetota bacterium]